MRKIRINALTILLVFIIILTIFTPVMATDTFYPFFFQASRTIVFTPHNDFGAESIQHFNEALWQWNSATGRTLFRREPTARHTQGGAPGIRDGNNLIYRGRYPSIPAPAAAYPHRRIVQNVEVVEEADIVINMEYPFSNGAFNNNFDVWTVFMHEAGHILSLDHPSAGQQALRSTMEVLPRNSLRRTLSASDINMANSRLW